MPEVNIGLIPGWGGTQRLPRIADITTAVMMLLTGMPLTLPEALCAQLVSTVSDNPLSAAYELLKSGDYEQQRRQKAEALPLLERELLKEALLDQHKKSTAASLELVNVVLRGCEQPLQDGLAIEAAAFLRLTGSAEATERITAFLDSRKKPSA
jgi:enoyl-CoA hydratase/carnithine racemase